MHPAATSPAIYAIPGGESHGTEVKIGFLAGCTTFASGTRLNVGVPYTVEPGS